MARTRKSILADLEIQKAVVDLAATGIPLTTEQAAMYLQLAKGTLEVDRVDNSGPKCIFVLSRPRYLKNDLDQWIAESGSRRKSAVKS